MESRKKDNKIPREAEEKWKRFCDDERFLCFVKVLIAEIDREIKLELIRSSRLLTTKLSVLRMQCKWTVASKHQATATAEALEHPTLGLMLRLLH